MIRRLSAIAFFAGMTAFCAAASASPELRVEGSYFEDRAGRVVVLRGANVSGSSKVPPFMPVSRGELLDPLEQAGMNVIRLLFAWEAYEGTAGVHDEAYLEHIAEVSSWAWERGIHVIIDFHQDTFSRHLLGGCGDGFPRWVLPPTVTPATPDNGPGCANWGFRLLGDEDVRAAWASFYAAEWGVPLFFGEFGAQRRRGARIQLWSFLRLCVSASLR
jgi:endoglycosylceramidase